MADAQRTQVLKIVRFGMVGLHPFGDGQIQRAVACGQIGRDIRIVRQQLVEVGHDRIGDFEAWNLGKKIHW